MVRRLWNTAIERAEALALDELPDTELLARFLVDPAGSAFAAVVRRHGPLVWGVCRNLLPAEADAEDAFQATFLALVKGAGRIRKATALGAWLHGVAGRVCRNSLRAKARRDRHERSAAVPEATAPVSADVWDRWQTAVHEEVDRLPRPMREAFVLCVLQGVRQPDAAKRLGWSLGSVSGRVCQAKKRLVAALGRRGLTGAAGAAAVLGGGATAGPISVGLMNRAAAVAAGGPIPQIIDDLARGAIGGLMGKSKLLAAGLLAAGLAVGTGLVPTAEGQVPGGPPGTGPLGPPPASGGPAGPMPLPELPMGGPGGAGNPFNRGPGAMPGMARPTAAAAKVEYQFVSAPKDVNGFKDLLAKFGSDGWEYVGTIPGTTELILKRTAAPGFDPFAGVGMPPPMPGGPTPGAGNYGPPAAGPRPGGSSRFPTPGPGGPGTPPGGPGASGPTGGFPGFPPGAGPAESPPGVGRPGPGGPSGTGPAAPPGMTPPLPMHRPFPGAGPTVEEGEPGPATKASNVVALTLGETIRHRMLSGAEIDRIKVSNRVAAPKIADVTPDPVNGKRVLIAASSRGEMTVELTDANGVKEAYTIRVR